MYLNLSLQCANKGGFGQRSICGTNETVIRVSGLTVFAMVGNVAYTSQRVSSLQCIRTKYVSLWGIGVKLDCEISARQINVVITLVCKVVLARKSKIG